MKLRIVLCIQYSHMSSSESMLLRALQESKEITSLCLVFNAGHGENDSKKESGFLIGVHEFLNKIQAPNRYLRDISRCKAQVSNIRSQGLEIFDAKEDNIARIETLNYSDLVISLNRPISRLAGKILNSGVPLYVFNFTNATGVMETISRKDHVRSKITKYLSAETPEYRIGGISTGNTVQETRLNLVENFVSLILRDIFADWELSWVRGGFEPSSNPNKTHELPLMFFWFYMLHMCSSVYLKVLNRIFPRNNSWTVSIASVDVKSEEVQSVFEIENPRGYFLADPFLVECDEQVFCFVEEWIYSKSKGVISTYKVTGEKVERLGIVLEEEFHLSFPFIFEWNQKYYMCPETAEKKEIRLYECINFPFSWKFHSILIPDINAVDSLLVPIGGVWWLITNVSRGNNPNYSSELAIYSADSPLSTDWKLESIDPICDYPVNSRNGGLVVRGKEFFRVRQSRKPFHYGSSFSLHKIIGLQSGKVIEGPSILKSREMGQFKSAHHLSNVSNFMAFDFQRGNFGRVTNSLKKCIQLMEHKFH